MQRGGQIMRHLVFVPMLLVTSLFSWFVAADENPPDKSPEVAARYESLKRSVIEYSFAAGEPPGEQLELIKEPVLRWNNPISGDKDGMVAVWTLRGRPVVLCQGFISKQDIWWHEFQSLSEKPFAASLREEVFWQPERAGVEWQRLADAAAPAPNPAGRLRQMKTLAGEFTAAVHFKAVSTDNATTRHELRLLPQPLYRYSSPDDLVVDGGLFAFVQGTNPEVVLLVEARGKESAQAWHYALAPASAYEVEASRSGAKIWGVPNHQGKKTREGPFWQHRFVGVE